MGYNNNIISAVACCWFYLMIFNHNNIAMVFAQRRQELNGRCRIVNDCKPIGYYCAKNSTCQCRTGYLPDEQWIQCLGYVGSVCIYDDHCIHGAYCTRGLDGYERCQCKQEENYFPDEDNFLCINSASAKTIHNLPNIRYFFTCFLISTTVFTKLLLNTK